jgi:hypothetical protein
MSSKRIVLLTIGVVAIGIFALPSTMSLFAGQHVWYDLSGGGNDVPCEKCHADIADEYQDAFAHPLYMPHKTYTCSHCHRISGFGENSGNQMTYARGDGSGSTPGKEAHAAITVECMDCHDLNYMFGRPPPPPSDHHMFNPQYQTPPAGQNPGGGPYPGCGWGGPPEKGPRNCHAPPRQQDNIAMIRAGGFGLTDFDNMSAYYYWRTWPNDTGSYAAHRQFVLDAIEDDTMAGANEACIACHTHVAVKLNWTHARSLEFDIGVGNPKTTDSGVHNWSMSNWEVNGTVNVLVWGNTTGAGSTSNWDEWPGDVDSIYG